jgi:hypothetical protein
MCLEEMPEIVALGKMKQLAGQFTKGLPGGAQFRQTLYHSHSVQEILANISVYFDGIELEEGLGGSVIPDTSDIESCEAFTNEQTSFAMPFERAYPSPPRKNYDSQVS